tara:strand:+ start:156 stop:617 length:462 start_codon:yes stop_codon:yes gene_type:complete
MKNIYFLIVLLLFTTNINAQIFKEKYINDATKIANEWLDNVINKDYGIAYSNYSNEVKANSDSTYWLQAIDQLMNEFGPFKKREIINKEFKSNIENLGDGFYVLIEYKSNYENINFCNEYILLGQNDKLKWKILRYDFSYESEQLDPDEGSSN